jgi:hypothetical protein
MEILHRLLTDISLLLFLLASTLINNLIVVTAWQGLFGLHVLSFNALKTLFDSLSGFFVICLLLTVSFVWLPITSFLYSNFAYSFDNHFGSLDIFLTSISFFCCIFYYMGGGKILLNLRKLEKLKEMDYYSKLWWLEIDSSLTPTIIITSLIAIGVLISYYNHNV